MPSGRLWAVNASNAVAWMGMALAGVPRTDSWPSISSMSSSAASSWWAAMALALAMTWSVAIATATPPTGSERLP